jgi:hypothetical protein
MHLITPRHRATCCATCCRWYAKRHVTTAWCPVLGEPLPEDLLTVACAAWLLETVESAAVELYTRLCEQENPQ